MRAPFKIAVLLVFLLCACNFPGPGETAPDPESVPAADTPIQDESATECGFVWARQPLPELSIEFETALQGALPQASGYAEAYGENCINPNGEVVRFLTMETDYHVTLKVEGLEDKQALGGLAEQVLSVVAQFPVADTPGPQPGYVGITFAAPAEELRLWFTRREAESALENGLRGEALFNALQE